MSRRKKKRVSKGLWKAREDVLKSRYPDTLSRWQNMQEKRGSEKPADWVSFEVSLSYGSSPARFAVWLSENSVSGQGGEYEDMGRATSNTTGPATSNTTGFTPQVPCRCPADGRLWLHRGQSVTTLERGSRVRELRTGERSYRGQESG